MSRFVRASKFRHVYGDPFKKDECYDNVPVTRNAWDSNFCSVNEKFLAVVTEAGGGGAFYVLNLNQHGKIDADVPRVVGHKNAVLDVAWNPFNPNMIASGSDDCTAKIWIIPDGGLKENMSEAALTLEGHGRKVGNVYWHPTASDLLFTCSNDCTIRVWNVSTGEQVNCIAGHSDVIYSLSFNTDGSKFVTTCKDKKIRIFNARSGEIEKEVEGHGGAKASRAVWLTDKNMIITTGFSRQSERQYKLWDLELNQLKEENIDTSSGVLMPFYDSDLGILYLAGKGDGNVRYFEITDVKPYVFYLSEYKSSDPQRGMGWLPKRACDVAKCEVARMYKLHPKNLVEPIRMIVPRKSDTFQEDIYPDCESDKPALTADEWLSGKDAAPLRLSLRDGFKPAEQQAYVAPTPVAKGATPMASAPAAAAAVAVPSPAADNSEKEALVAEVESLKQQLAARDLIIAQLKVELEQLKLAGQPTEAGNANDAPAEETSSELANGSEEPVEASDDPAETSEVAN